MQPSSQRQNFYFIYIDESYDKTHFAYTAMLIDAFRWDAYFNYLLDWRQKWYQQYNFRADSELHATDFVGGRGGENTNRDKNFRARLFYEAIGRVEKMPDVFLVNGFTSEKSRHLTLFERMLNSINQTLQEKNAFGVLICDEGNEKNLTSLVRRMKRKKVIPPPSGPNLVFGATSRDIPLDNIIEDPLFKESKSSYFIQLADFLAYALLRHEAPLPQTHEQVRTAFEQLESVLVKEAFRSDPKQKGIVRV